MELINNHPGVLAVAAFVYLISCARIVRLLTQDTFPPVVWFRIKWDNYTDGNGWNALFHCHWCLPIWIVVPVGLWGWLTNLHASWWVFNVALAAAYLVSMIVERDEKE